jgi:hypothetical protein
MHKRYFVELNQAQEKVQLQKANRYTNSKQNQLKETLLSNKLLQELID